MAANLTPRTALPCPVEGCRITRASEQSLAVHLSDVHGDAIQVAVDRARSVVKRIRPKGLRVVVRFPKAPDDESQDWRTDEP